MSTTIDYQTLINNVYNKVKHNTDGHVATYISALGRADPRTFGLSICDLTGRVYNVGNAEKKIPVESISKLFTLALAIKKHGKDMISNKIGTSGSFLPFNSIIAEKLSPSHTINPFVNQGAMATTSLLYQANHANYKKRLIDNMSAFANCNIRVDNGVYKSESANNYTNLSLAYLLKSMNRFYGPVEKVVDAYTYQCSAKVSAKDLAVMASVFANQGIHPKTGEKLLDRDECIYLISVLGIAGLYEYSSTWAVKTGGKSYAKSGVGGGIIIVIPNVCGIGITSPRLDKIGNSARGIQAGILLSNILGRSVFDTTFKKNTTFRKNTTTFRKNTTYKKK